MKALVGATSAFAVSACAVLFHAKVANAHA